MQFSDISARFPVVDLDEVHDALCRDDARRQAAGAGTDGLAPIALCVGTRAWTVSPGRPVSLAPGVAAAATCVVEFADARAFSDYFHELRTAPGAHLSGTVRYSLGGYGAFDDWEPALRALYQGRPVYDPQAVGRDELDRTFGVDEADEIGRFVQAHGFAVVRGVFTADEVAGIDAAVTALEAASAPTTPGTWWTTDATGTPAPCQLHYVTERDPSLSWIDADARVRRLVDACIPGLVAHADRMNGHFAVLKRPGARDGMVDLPWHIDCGLGGHALMCPGLHLGIQLTGSGPDVGAFSVLAGSHDASVPRRAVDPETWPVVTVATAPGDVTIHVPHAMHAAPPPTGQGRGRRTLYLGFGRAEAHELIGPGRSFDDLLSATADDGFVTFDER